jgi:hypothetical protein
MSLNYSQSEHSIPLATVICATVGMTDQSQFWNFILVVLSQWGWTSLSMQPRAGESKAKV